MSLTTGNRLGSYEILSLLGAGGMGEVYRARDTKLGRDVALKILPELFAHDAERVARFRREAQLLAALNHPHIAAIYGLEEANGSLFLVLELVEGPTLAQLLADAGSTGPPRGDRSPGPKGPGPRTADVGRVLSDAPRGGLPVNEALTIARQVADALQAAHEKGILHRDLKPANIALTAEGQVKVLDFGLAKAFEPDPLADTSNSPTLSLAGTQPGVILGTAAYMSPEQAKGRVADKRSDVWAFGCVLYEMLTGKRAFGGEDISDTLASVLKSEPDWSAMPSKLPASIPALVQRCLEKDRGRRIADISVARYVLDEPPVVAVPAAAIAGPISRTPWFSGWRRAVTYTMTALATLALGGAIIWFSARSSVSPPRVSRLTMTSSGAAALTISGNDRDLAIAPDGSRIVYVGNNGTQLFVRALDALEPVAIYKGAPRGPFVSPDGQWVGFVDGNTTLKKVAITGGPAVALALIDSTPRGAAWTPDDTIIFATTTSATGLQRVSAAGGAPTVLTRPDRTQGEGDHLWPEMLPGGRAVLFTVTAVTGGLDVAQVAVLDLQTGAR